MKTVTINTEVSRRYKTDIVMGESNSVSLKIKIVPPLDSEEIDYDLVHYMDANNRKFISRQLYLTDDGYIIDTLLRNMLLTTELSLIVKGYNSDETTSVMKSPKQVLVIQDSGEKHRCNKCDSRDDGLLAQLKNVIETITVDGIIYYPEHNNIEIPKPIEIESIYLDEEYNLHFVKSNGEDICVGYVRGATGPLPEKGVDYFTEEDINAIISAMDANARGTQMVDDIHGLPTIGNPNIIYVDKTENDMYRWDDVEGAYKKVGADLAQIKILSGGGANGN